MSVPWPPPHTRYPKHLDTTLQPDHHPQTSCPFSLGVRDKDDTLLCVVGAGGNFALELPDDAPAAWRAGEGGLQFGVTEAGALKP